jgi:hypothetical protein
LDHQHFEYDIILNREPESSRILLAIEGWEGFDFFRQPDNIGPDNLRGSYAVYKKETLPGEGTGKLCHIHRPKIVDARGRWAWGDIWIDRGLLTMRLPEKWLGEAKYPVTVDPVVGSSMIGAYYERNYLSQEEHEMYLEEKAEDPSADLDWYISNGPMEFMQHTILNKSKTSVQLQGIYNVYVYLERIKLPSSSYVPDYEVVPLLFSDHNNKPRYLLNYDCSYGNPMANLSHASNFTPRWVPSTMTVNDPVAANTDLWFGYFGDNGSLRFDYAAPLLQTYDIGIDYWVREEYSALHEMAVDCDFLNVDYCTEYFPATMPMLLRGPGTT